MPSDKLTLQLKALNPGYFDQIDQVQIVNLIEMIKQHQRAKKSKSSKLRDMVKGAKEIAHLNRAIDDIDLDSEEELSRRKHRKHRQRH